MVSGRSYTVLFDKVPIEQVPLIVSKLQEKQIPYQLTDGGKTISVPPGVSAKHPNDADERDGFQKIGQMGLNSLIKIVLARQAMCSELIISELFKENLFGPLIV